MVLGGKQYQDATSVVALMAFYPIHQTIGQINGTFYYSTARTKEYRNVGMFIIPFGLVLSYIFIAPVSNFGLNLGAVGLAYQMLLIQLISVNVTLWLNCKYLKIDFLPLLLFQILILTTLGLFGFSIKYTLNLFISWNFLNAGLFFVLFSCISALMIYIKPSIVGFQNRVELINLIKMQKSK